MGFETIIPPSLSEMQTQDAMNKMKLHGMGQDSRLRQLQMQQAEQGMSEDSQLRQLLPQIMQGGDPNEAISKLAQLGPKGMEMAGKLASLTQAMAKDTKASWQDMGDKMVQIDHYGNPTGKTMPKGATPKEFQPSDIARLTRERDMLDKADPKRRLYDAALTKATTHQPGTSISYGAPVSGMDQQGNPVFFQPSKGGGAPSIIPGVKPAADTGKAPTEAEAKAAFYAQNMKAASATYQNLVAGGYDPTQSGTQIDTAIAGGNTNVLAGKSAQMAKQSQNQWSEMMLRMLTGAAATTDEINRNNATYFPQIGDDKETVRQKELMRKQAEEGVFSASGRASSRVHVPAQQQAQQGQKSSNALPNPATLPEGAIVTDKVSGKKMRVSGGKYTIVR